MTALCIITILHCNIVGYEVNNHDEVKLKMIQDRWEGSVRIYTCNICNKTSHRRQILSNHVETHIDGFEYPCEICQKTFRSKNSLQSHMSKLHK